MTRLAKYYEQLINKDELQKPTISSYKKLQCYDTNYVNVKNIQDNKYNLEIYIKIIKTFKMCVRVKHTNIKTDGKKRGWSFTGSLI